MKERGRFAALGSEGSEGSEGSKGSKGCGLPLCGNKYICRLTAAALPEAAKTIQPRLTVSRLKGRPFYVQAMGQLRLTCTFSAECAQRVGKAFPLARSAGLSPHSGVASELGS